MNKKEFVYTDSNQPYHLRINASHVADNVLIVGDVGRVELFARHLSDKVYSEANRNFRAVRGSYEGVDLTIMSHGIGVGNIDIFINELDAAVNIDSRSGETLPQLRSLNIIRYGTCGSINEEFELGQLILSRYSIGLDGLPAFYNYRKDKYLNIDLVKAFIRKAGWSTALPLPYAIEASENLAEHFSDIAKSAITICAPGFYGPQSRTTRLNCTINLLKDELGSLRYNDLALGNIEMESAPLYAIARALGHRVVTLSTVLAERKTGLFAKDSDALVQSHVLEILNKLTVL